MSNELQPEWAKKAAAHLDQVAREQQRILFEQLRDFSKSFDHVMVTLSAGAIALSVAFLERLTGPDRAYLVVAWGSLLIALVCVLVNYQVQIFIAGQLFRASHLDEMNMKTLEIAIETRDWDRAGQLLKSAAVESLIDSAAKYRPVSMRLTVTSIGAFVIGLILLLIVAASA